MSRATRNRLVATAVLAAAAAVAAWYWTRSARQTLPNPPRPADISDPEVRHAVETARGRVLAEPESAEAWGEYGFILLAHLMDRDADPCFARAAKLNPADPRWPYCRGRIAAKLDPDRADEHFRRAIDCGGTPDCGSAARLALAESMLARRNLDAATELFRQELDTPNNPRATFGLALVSASRGDDAAAVRLFESVQDSPHCRKQVAAQLAGLTRTSDPAAARGHEARVAALPDDPPWPDPILDPVRELQVGTRGARRIARMEAEGRFHEALAEYEVQLAVERSPKALTGAGALLAHLQQYERAERLLREAVERDPKDPRARYTLTLVLFTRAEQAWHGNPGAAEVKAKLESVVAEAMRTIDLKPDQAEAHLFWGLAFKYLGDPKGAIAPLRKGLAARSDHFELNLALGQVLAATGDRAGAEASLKTAQQLDPTDPRPAQELAKLK